MEVLGRENVFVTIFESGSWNSSKHSLQALNQDLEGMLVERNITLGDATHEQFVSQRPDGAEWWVRTGRGKEELGRILYLAKMRNKGLRELGKLVEVGQNLIRCCS